MNRTKKLMTTVTTSLLLTGALPASGVLSPAFCQTPKSDEARKTDPEVGKAANQIHEWLKRIPPAQAKTKEEIQKQFPTLSSAMIDNALKRLQFEVGLRRKGDGSPANPYRYYEEESGGE